VIEMNPMEKTIILNNGFNFFTENQQQTRHRSFKALLIHSVSGYPGNSVTKCCNQKIWVTDPGNNLFPEINDNKYLSHSRGKGNADRIHGSV